MVMVGDSSVGSNEVRRHVVSKKLVGRYEASKKVVRMGELCGSERRDFNFSDSILTAE
jgi:hypothetical protein